MSIFCFYLIMQLTYFRVRCFICFKRYSIPQFKDTKQVIYYFQDFNKEIRYYKWKGNEKVSNAVNYILAKQQELNRENAYTKGRTALQLVSKLADGNYTIKQISAFSACPRCKQRFHSRPQTKERVIEIKELTFNSIKNLTFQEIEYWSITACNIK